MEGRNEVGEGRGEGDGGEHIITMSFKAAVIMLAFTLSGLEGFELLRNLILLMFSEFF